jgi:hypothetical protein
MNRISLAFTLGMATQAAMAASASAAPNDSNGNPVLDKKARPATVVLPSAFQRERKVGITVSVGKGKRLRLGLLTGPRALSHTLPFGTSAPLRPMAGVEYDQRTEWGFVNAKFGALRNTNPLLGKIQTDNSLWRPANRTAFSSLSLGLALSPKWALVGMASFGRTSAGRNEIGTADTVASTAAAFSIGLSARELLSKGDNIGIALIAPTRAAGFANVDGTPGAPHGAALGARYSIDF